MSEMSLEERALRHADKYFDTEDKWYPGRERATRVTFNAQCVGLMLEAYRYEHGAASRGAFVWSSVVMGVPSVTKWNDALPSFKAMKSALKARIKHYKGLRR